MKPPEVALRDLVVLWLQKADRDFEVAEHLLGERGRFQETAASGIARRVKGAVMASLRAYLAGE